MHVDGASIATLDGRLLLDGEHPGLGLVPGEDATGFITALARHRHRHLERERGALRV